MKKRLISARAGACPACALDIGLCLRRGVCRGERNPRAETPVHRRQSHIRA